MRKSELFRALGRKIASRENAVTRSRRAKGSRRSRDMQKAPEIAAKFPAIAFFDEQTRFAATRPPRLLICARRPRFYMLRRPSLHPHEHICVRDETAPPLPKGSGGKTPLRQGRNGSIGPLRPQSMPAVAPAAAPVPASRTYWVAPTAAPCLLAEQAHQHDAYGRSADGNDGDLHPSNG